MNKKLILFKKQVLRLRTLGCFIFVLVLVVGCGKKPLTGESHDESGRSADTRTPASARNFEITLTQSEPSFQMPISVSHTLKEKLVLNHGEQSEYISLYFSPDDPYDAIKCIYQKSDVNKQSFDFVFDACYVNLDDQKNSYPLTLVPGDSIFIEQGQIIKIKSSHKSSAFETLLKFSIF